ncbi:hypothetical protein Y956_16541, partial [Nipponia nippon]
APIDFLLFYECEDFDGMCCMNLSDNSESIHKAIRDLKEGVSKLQVSDGLGWLNHL